MEKQSFTKKEKDEYLEKLGKHIKKIRNSKGYSHDRVYLEGGLSRATMSRIESGKVDAQIWTLARIAKILHVPLRKLTDVDIEGDY